MAVGVGGKAKARAILLLGPTACGKSAFAGGLAAQAAAHGGLEIVSIDSAHVYRGLDIGSAKPSLAERAAVPHHLIDIRDPAQAYSAAEFRDDAVAAIDDIVARGRLPLIVGGTMMYARVLRQGIADLPPADPAIRARIQAQAEIEGWPALHERLAKVDPATAGRLAPGDRQRIGRALEVWETSGRPMSELLADSPQRGIAVRTIALLPPDRAQLHARIEQRFDDMLAGGFLDEVRALRARPELHADLPALRSVGYRQAWAHLETGTDFAKFRAAAIAATRQLAKRQITWLRSMNDALFIDPFADVAREQLRGAVFGDTEVDDRPSGH
jgi:tRNA dimethylallyltransferase